jgi:hypothetical protein
MESTDYEENTTKTSKFEDIKQKIWGQTKYRHDKLRWTIPEWTGLMMLMYRTLTPNYMTQVQVMAMNESPRSMLDDYSDGHVNKTSAFPDFTLDKDDGPMDVYCCATDTEVTRINV